MKCKNCQAKFEGTYCNACGEKVIREKLNTASAYKYRYLIGSYKTKRDAKAVLEKVRSKGFPDAIIIEKA